jgi:hypothetical protein
MAKSIIKIGDYRVNLKQVSLIYVSSASNDEGEWEISITVKGRKEPLHMLQSTRELELLLKQWEKATR